MDILQAVSPLQFIYQLCNLTPWLLDKKSWTLKPYHPLQVYTILVICTASSILLYGLFVYDDFMKTSLNEIAETVDFIQLTGIRTAHLVSIVEALVRRNDQRMFYDQLKQIDKIFERSLNIDVNNGKFRRCTLKRGLIISLVYLATEGFILMSKFILDTPTDFYLYWLCYLLPLLICGLRYFQIFTAIRLLQTRFDKLVNVLNDINLEDGAKDHTNSWDCMLKTFRANDSHQALSFTQIPMKPTNTSHHSLEQAEIRKLLIVRDVYNRLFGLTNILNRYFGLSILINVGNDFISITSNCYWIFINFKNYTSNALGFLHIVGSAVWSLPHLLNLLILAIQCEKTMQSNTSIALGLHRIQIDILNDNQNAVIQQFSLQLLHQKISITAAGFFSIDCSLLYTIVGATTTYLIILIQFYLNVAPGD